MTVGQRPERSSYEVVTIVPTYGPAPYPPEKLASLEHRFHDVRVHGQTYSLPARPLRFRLPQKAAERLALATTWPIRLPLAPTYIVAVCRRPRR